MTKHYVCTGECGGSSPNPGICKAQDCSMFQQDMAPCDCTDGSHGSGMTPETHEPIEQNGTHE
ncbi:MAG: hypothetical protein AAB972_03345 [Patescibacteria group bacterium]